MEALSQALSPTVELRGTKLRELRKARGVDAKDLAGLVGITRDYLYKLELGHSKRCSPGVFGSLCDGLGLTAEERRELLATDEPPASHDDPG